MTAIGRLWSVLAIGALAGLPGTLASAAPTEWNPVRTRSVEIGPEASRLLVGFRIDGNNTVIKAVTPRGRAQGLRIVQAQTSRADVLNLIQRSNVALVRSQQITPAMHVLFLPKRLYGADLNDALRRLRADTSVEFAEIDQRRLPHALPDDPLFLASPNATGQWFMQTPSTATVTSDASATDAVSAWAITTGSSGTVIADVDTGILFDHPDLLRAGFDSQRAGFGGRLLPGYDFVDQDYNPTSGVALGTFLIANDGDGWDPDPSDPGDWINSVDRQNTTLFPAANCDIADSSWHGTRVMGILGALTDNNLGVAGMTWNPYILPVRALGKCGGYDSDIIAGMRWAAGLSVSDVPDNPYPADIINLSLGGSGACPGSYQSTISTLTSMGVLVVASAGNENGPVDSPGNCSGVLTVAGLRNVGTKVGYSSLGAEVGIAAPAGNCVNQSGPCLRSIDTTMNTGLTTPGSNTYSDQINMNLGTSFSAPIVAGVVALMRAVNANLTPAQLIARIESSASPFPHPTGLPQCPAASSTGECACVPGQCGAGMVNALSAVVAARKPIAAVALPPRVAAGSNAVFDAGGSAASCGRSIAAYAWTVTGGLTLDSVANARQVTITPGSGMGTLTLTVTDSAGDTDIATVHVTASTATTSAPASAGGSAGACPAALTVTPAAPTLSEAFSPATAVVNTPATLTMTFTNSNGFVLTQSQIAQTLPANLSIEASPAPSTTCTGASLSLTSTDGSVTLKNANIPANGSCGISVSVASALAGSYTNTLAAGALETGPAGGNLLAVSATLTVSETPAAPQAPAAATTGKSGGGALDYWDMMFAAGVILAGRRYRGRRPRP